jgi:hypothetical protein
VSKKTIARFLIFVNEMQNRRSARGKAPRNAMGRVALMKIADGVYELPGGEA